MRNRCHFITVSPACRSGYLGAESFDSSAIASCTVVMNCAGKMMVEFFSTEISAIVCRVRSCSATGCWVMMSAASPSFTAAWYSPSAATILARRSRSASASFAIARCMFSGSVMSLISTAVTWVPQGSVCRSMTFLIWSLMLAVSEKQLIEAETSDDVTHGGLADLVDGVIDILDSHHGFLRIGDVIVGNRRDIDRDVVLGDDLLRRDLHGDGAQRHPHHLLDGNEDQRQPRSAYAFELSKQKDHPALILFQDANRSDGVEDNDRYEKREEDSIHDVLIGLLVEQPASVSGVGRFAVGGYQLMKSRRFFSRARPAPDSETNPLPQ